MHSLLLSSTANGAFYGIAHLEDGALVTGNDRGERTKLSFDNFSTTTFWSPSSKYINLLNQHNDEPNKSVVVSNVQSTGV